MMPPPPLPHQHRSFFLHVFLPVFSSSKLSEAGKQGIEANGITEIEEMNPRRSWAMMNSNNDVTSQSWPSEIANGHHFEVTIRLWTLEIPKTTSRQSEVYRKLVLCMLTRYKLTKKCIWDIRSVVSSHRLILNLWIKTVKASNRNMFCSQQWTFLSMRFIWKSRMWKRLSPNEFESEFEVDSFCSEMLRIHVPSAFFETGIGNKLHMIQVTNSLEPFPSTFPPMLCMFGVESVLLNSFQLLMNLLKIHFLQLLPFPWNLCTSTQTQNLKYN